MSDTIRRSAITDERDFRTAKAATRARRASARGSETESAEFTALAAYYAGAFSSLSVRR